MFKIYVTRIITSLNFFRKKAGDDISVLLVGHSNKQISSKVIDYFWVHNLRPSRGLNFRERYLVLPDQMVLF